MTVIGDATLWMTDRITTFLSSSLLASFPVWLSVLFNLDWHTCQFLLGFVICPLILPATELKKVANVPQIQNSQVNYKASDLTSLSVHMCFCPHHFDCLCSYDQLAPWMAKKCSPLGTETVRIMGNFMGHVKICKHLLSIDLS